MNLLRRLYSVVRSNLESPQNRDIPPLSSENDAISPPSPRESLEAGYYANLELSPGASYPEIKTAYRRLLREYHPDKHAQDPNKSKTAEHISKGLNEAMDYFEKRHKGGRL